MTNIKKVAAGFILGAAITSAPLVAFATPAFADTGAATPVSDAPSHMNIPPWGYKGSAKAQHVLVNSASTGQSDSSRVLVNAGSAGSLRDGNAARCGGGINC
jgi:hypothetical protein